MAASTSPCPISGTRPRSSCSARRLSFLSSSVGPFPVATSSVSPAEAPLRRRGELLTTAHIHPHIANSFRVGLQTTGGRSRSHNIFGERQLKQLGLKHPAAPEKLRTQTFRLVMIANQFDCFIALQTTRGNALPAALCPRHGLSMLGNFNA